MQTSPRRHQQKLHMIGVLSTDTVALLLLQLIFALASAMTMTLNIPLTLTTIMIFELAHYDGEFSVVHYHELHTS